MPTNYYMPTRIIAGYGALDEIGRVARDLKITNALVVSDPIISAQTFHARALARLTEDGIRSARFDECGIDARCSHIDDQGERVRRDGVDGVISIGGGSVMCTGKGIAIVATNRKPMRECTGVGNFDRKALPMIMVPTTAGSGSEVSQWTIVKDEERHLKLLGGGPLSFPDAAVLDPVTLDTLPIGAAAPPAVDALTHGLEAYLSALASPLTDAVALEAVRLQAGSMRASITSNDAQARADNLIASTMANIACGNARLGHAHALSLPLEGHLDLVHTTGVGVLMPHVLAFNMAVDAVKAKKIAEALGVDTEGLSRGEIIEAAVAELYELYADIGFRPKFTADELPRDRIREMAERAVPGLYAGFSGATNAPENVTDRTIIVSRALRKMTVRQAEEIFEACAA